MQRLKFYYTIAVGVILRREKAMGHQFHYERIQGNCAMVTTATPSRSYNGNGQQVCIFGGAMAVANM